MTDDEAERTSSWPTLVLVTASLIVTPVLLLGAGLVERTVGLTAVVVMIGLLVGLLALVAIRGSDSGRGNDEDAAVWDAIPRWQYGGRHVESGGMTRDEQERALEEIEAQAEAIERFDVDDADEPPSGR